MTSRVLQVESAAQAEGSSALQTVELLDLRLVTGAYEDVAERLLSRAQAGPPLVAAHVNLNNYYELRRRGARWDESPDLQLLFDGIGLKLAAWTLGQGWVRDLNGTDLFPVLMRRAAAERMRVFFLGATHEVVERAAHATVRAFPGLVLAGYHDGYFAPAQSDSVVERVRAARPDLLVVGMGFPRQEEFALAHRGRLGARLIWTAGGLFDFVSGAKPRAPLALRRMRLEWLYRLYLEPRRMWRRNTIPPMWLAWRILRRR